MSHITSSFTATKTTAAGSGSAQGKTTTVCICLLTAPDSTGIEAIAHSQQQQLWADLYQGLTRLNFSSEAVADADCQNMLFISSGLRPSKLEACI